MTEVRQQKIIFWGGDLVSITQDVTLKDGILSKGTQGRIEVSRGKIVVSPNDRVLLWCFTPKMTHGFIVAKGKRIGVPAKYLQRVLSGGDYTVNCEHSISGLSEYRGGMFSPR